MNIVPANSVPSKTKERCICIVVPSLGGHRQLYASVLADWAVKQGRSVVIATMQKAETLNEVAPLIARRAGMPQIDVLSMPRGQEASGDVAPFAAFVLELERQLYPEWVIIANADMHLDDLKGLEQTATRPKRAAIMNSTACFYPIHAQLQGRELRYPVLSRLRKYISLRSKRKQQKRFYLRTAFKQLGVDKILTMDDRYYESSHGDTRFALIPEIYRTWDDCFPGERDRMHILQKEYDSFLKSNSGKDVILHFGGFTARRGYDTLMKIAADDENSVFVSIGRPSRREQLFDYDIKSLRDLLRYDKRIFKRRVGFITNNEFVDHLFESAHYIILPYRRFFLSSGALITAAAYGRPVLVPSGGNMHYQVSKYNIGLAYKHLSYSSLMRNRSILQHRYGEYQADCLEFAKRFSRQTLFQTLTNTLLSNTF